MGRAARLTAGAVLLVSVAACGSASTGSTGGTTSGSGSGSGAAIANGAAITFGQTLPETGPAAQYKTSAAGVAAYFAYVNAQGGVQGHKLNIISVDDQYQPPVSVQLTRKLVNEQNIFAEVAPNGSAAVKADLTVLDPANIPIIGPQTGANFLYTNPPRKNVFSVWPSYALEGKLLGTYAMNTLHLKKIGVFYQNDDFGKSLLGGFQSSGAQAAVEAPYDPTQTDYSPDAVKFKNANVDGVIFFAVPGPATGMLNALSAINFKPARILSQTGVTPQTFQTAAAGFPGSYVGSFIPPVQSTGNPGVDLFKKEMAQYQSGVTPDIFAGWGWEAAQVAVAGLQAIKGPITHDSYEKALETIQNLQILGGTIGYSAASHEGLKKEGVVQAVNGMFVPAP